MVPAPYGGDDFVRVGRPGEGLRVVVGLAQKAFNGGLEIDNRPKHAALETAFAELGEETFNSIKPRHEVGV